MSSKSGYPTAPGVEAAIKEAAKRAYRADPSVSVTDRIRQAHFDRFLCRVFSEGEECQWILKGGTGMLARVPNSRATLDIDLYRFGYTLDQALTDLRRFAEIDLHDHFSFAYRDHSRILPGNAQPYADGYRVNFDTYVGAKKVSPVGVDLAVGASVTGTVSVMSPANRLDLPKLETTDYRLYPIVDQIADKVCATMTEYPQGASSRTKDLIDLVVIANSHDIDATALRTAVDIERRRRGLPPFKSLVVPADWSARYTKMARTLPHCAKYLRIEDAKLLMGHFLAPVFGKGLRGRWEYHRATWEWHGDLRNNQ